ncbi:molybdopterin-binding oxidoreductase [Serinibacter arcticus]|uniref:Molybdopterin-binding oxidoreductase n=1 Tax=Serinibacter arcticus TaxID=1655435 RepID=A0A2U1ZWW2_9MICO|nr:molybdopterin-dependent oxidoreductase [Serinibacter arcticus]PWD51430.1 molybdopterin-binding oxidoreductase [Serinibacter arcticus]
MDTTRPQRDGDSDASPSAPPPTSTIWLPGRWLGALTGVVVVGLALAVAELLSILGDRVQLLNQFSSPLLAVGAAFITLTPEWLKQFAIATFGEQDKVALQVGMGVTVLIAAAVIGLVARRSPRVAAVLLAAFVAICGVAVLTRPAAVGVIDLLPSIVGGVVGVLVLGYLFRRREVAAPAAPVDPDVEPTPQDYPSRRTTTPVMDSALGRRRFLSLVGITAAAATAATAIGRFLPSYADVQASRDALQVPSATPQSFPDGLTLDTIEEAVDGQGAFLTPNEDFYRVDTALTLPNITADDWSLKIHGLVDRERTLTYDEIVNLPLVERTITLTCVSNEVGGGLVGTATWIGTPIKDLLEDLGPSSDADCVLCTSIDGFTLTAPLEALVDGRDSLLAVAMNGEILPQRNGFPVRMVVPGLYGYVSATKWIVDMKVSRFSDEVAYWTQRGWAEQAPIKTASRIDVPRGFNQAAVGDEVVIAGVAWAQQRGIENVEIQIDDGEWQPVELSPALSNDTWRQWRTTWVAEQGVHTIRCRAYDGTGELQTEEIAPPIPNGSSGYDARSITVS